MEKLVVAFESEKNCEKITAILESEGLRCLICRTGDQVRRLVARHHIYTVLCGYKLLEESAEEISADLPEYCSMLVLALPARLEFLQNPDICTLPAPAGRAALLDAVWELVERGRQREKAERPQRTEEDNALIVRAKESLMARHGWSEEAAYRALQKRSMDRGEHFADTARQVLAEAEAPWEN